MSLFKKLFGGKGASDKSSLFKDRSPRVRLTPLHRVSFFPSSEKTDIPILLSNISVTGMGLLAADAPEYKVGQEIAGSLHINNENFEIGARVRHVSQRVYGCEYIAHDSLLQQAIEQYFRVEILALNLTSVDESFLKPDPHGKVSWFTDGRQNEVYCVSDRDGLLNFHMTFLGNYIEGERGKPLRAGFTREDDESSDDPGHKQAALLEFSDIDTPTILDLASMLIRNVEKMPPDLQKELGLWLHHERQS